MVEYNPPPNTRKVSGGQWKVSGAHVRSKVLFVFPSKFPLRRLSGAPGLTPTVPQADRCPAEPSPGGGGSVDDVYIRVLSLRSEFHLILFTLFKNSTVSGIRV